MEQTNTPFSENVNEVIKPGGVTDFCLFITKTNGTLEQKVIPAFMKNSFVERFGMDCPNQIEYDYWYSEQTSKYNKNGNFKTDSLLG
ncbi:MAG: hypothetical protein WC979_00140 [Candidatus Pacearchaeota archaeon]|jgi:hypothetical protein|nr:hypothetical protein [Clostridia bacterium]